MSTSVEWLRAAIGAHLDAGIEATRARGHDEDAAQRLARAARSQLGTGEARERLEEAVSSRAIDDTSHAALLEHLASAAEAEVLARSSITLELASDDAIVVTDRSRTLAEIVGDARSGSREPARVAVAALADEAGRDRAARIDAFDEAAERGSRIRARGPRLSDRTPDDLHLRCTQFLDATDDAAEDVVARAHHATRSDATTLDGRLAALAPPALDRLTPRVGRLSRIGRVLADLRLEPELARRVTIEPSRQLAVGPTVLATGTRAWVLSSPIDVGLATEGALLGGCLEALARSLASPALPMELARAPIGSSAMAMGALFAALFADGGFLARHLDASDRELDDARVASTAAIVLDARHLCAIVASGAPSARTDEAARELAARALVLDPSIVSAELARTTRVAPSVVSARARAVLASLAWAPALRERYDSDFFRNPRLADFVRGVAARGGASSAEAVSIELGAGPALAAARVVELASGKRSG